MISDRGSGVYEKAIHAMDLLHENGLIFGNSICCTRKNPEAVTSDEFFDLLIEHGSRFAGYFYLSSEGMKAAPERMPTREQREYIYHRLREVRAKEGGREIFTIDFQNDREFAGGCIAGDRTYCHMNINGDMEPCTFFHYSGANIRDNTLLDGLKQLFNKNMPGVLSHAGKSGEMTITLYAFRKLQPGFPGQKAFGSFFFHFQKTMIGNTEGKQMLINIFSGRRVGQTDETMVRAVLLAF